MEQKVTAEDVVLGHVSMSRETYERIPIRQRPQVWAGMIAKLGISASYFPMLLDDPHTDTVFVNLIGLPPRPDETPDA